MAVRTEDFRRVGGFRTEFGKNGQASQPEDTDLCIRMAGATGKHWTYVPSAVIFHDVPASRASFAFFVKRCYSEGAGKAAMRANLDPSSVRTEHGYVRDTALAGLRRTATFSVSGVMQGLVMFVGLSAAAVGYALGLARPIAERVRRW
jgi:GT2 family glycosyltransferase